MLKVTSSIVSSVYILVVEDINPLFHIKIGVMSRGEDYLMEQISFELVGKVLEEDILSDLDVLLLKKGTILTEMHILLLRKHNYKRVKVSDNVCFDSLYLKYINNIEDLFSDLKRKEKIDINEWFRENSKIVRLVQKDSSLIGEIYKLQEKPNLLFHCANVGLIAFFLGKLLRYSYKDKLLLWQMGVLHDIGKLCLSEKNLDQKEDLTTQDLQLYKQHPDLGWNILKEVKGVNALMLNAVRCHHEQIDGSGYPKGINVKYLPVKVQIISVANKIDHIRAQSNNPFHLINTLIGATRESKLNPAIVIPFLRYILRNFIGKKVVLSDKTVAEIVFIFEHEPSQPLLYVTNKDEFIDLRKYPKLQMVDFAQ